MALTMSSGALITINNLMKRLVLPAGFFGLILLFFPNSATAQTGPQNVNAALVRTINTSSFSSPALNPAPDPSGITYDPVSKNLLIADSEVDEMAIYKGTNVFWASLTGSVNAQANTLSFSHEPTDIDFDPATGRYYVSDDDQQKIFTINAGTDGQFGTGDDSVTSFTTGSFGATDVEGIAFGQSNLYIADGANKKVYKTATSGSLIATFDLSSIGLTDLEGIAFNSDANSIFVLDAGSKRVAELTTSGNVTRIINIRAANPILPGDVAYGPTSNTADAETLKNLYISDRGVDNDANPNENDGKVYEMSLPGTPSPPPVSPTLTPGDRPGDANGDGKVDGLDYVIWRNNYNRTVTAGSSVGDFTNNGFVDGLDYVIWRNNYGTSV